MLLVKAQLIAWQDSSLTYYVSSGTLNLTNQLTCVRMWAL